jgi:hypothetical protein
MQSGADPHAGTAGIYALREAAAPLAIAVERGYDDPAKERMREFHDVTPLGYARQFQEPNWVNGPAVTAIVERGGTE